MKLRGELSKTLTPRELEITRLAAMGASNPMIAAQLHIAESTIKNHRRVIYEKLQLGNLADLTRYAIQNGIIEA